MLTKNERKDITEVITRLENRRIFLKETIEKVLSQEREKYSVIFLVQL